MRQTKLHRHQLMANPASSTLRIQKYTASCVTTSKHSSELTPPKPISRHASLMRASLPENDHVAHSNLSELPAKRTRVQAALFIKATFPTRNSYRPADEEHGIQSPVQAENAGQFSLSLVPFSSEQATR
ncbi:hypothetical protein HC256_003138 [Beauveria bassiana]|nr:hypothetical protein HC256_003138 [Beauveria bassiana]